MRLRCEGIYHIQASLRIAKGIKQHHAIYKGMFPEAKMDFLTSQKKLFNLKRSTSTTPHPGYQNAISKHAGAKRGFAISAGSQNRVLSFFYKLKAIYDHFLNYVNRIGTKKLFKQKK